METSKVMVSELECGHLLGYALTASAHPRPGGGIITQNQMGCAQDTINHAMQVLFGGSATRQILTIMARRILVEGTIPSLQAGGWL